MNGPPRILAVDDNPDSLVALEDRLTAHGYEVLTAGDGEEALAVVAEQRPDLILLDVTMPKLDGLEVCRRLKGDPSLPFIPIILVTARARSEDVVAGLEAGGDEYLTKPVDPDALVARVRSMLRIKQYHDTIQAQAAELAELNRTLDARVRQQAEELQRVRQLERYVAPQVAGLIVSSGGEARLERHRAEVTVVFCDLRGYTSFAETAAPEDMMDVLQQYHDQLGRLIFQYEATLERFAGDGIMVFFNDPVPCPNPAERAVRMALEMRGRISDLTESWRRRLGGGLGFGIGIDQGFATLGKIGFEDRFDYAAIGPVTSRSFRLSAAAGDDQILITQRVYAAVEELVAVERVGDLELKGFRDPVTAFNVVGPK